MTQTLVLGIDIGTSGARAVAMDESGTVVAAGAAKLAEFSRDHRDPSVWWQAVETAVNATLAQIDAKSVCAIAIDGTSGTVLPVDAQGNPLGVPMMYNDAVLDKDTLDAVASHAPQNSAAHGATSGLAKVLVFQALDDVAHILHQADWLAGRFTGRFDLSDENNALKTGYDPVSRAWPDWISATGANTDLLPKVLPAGTPMATISRDAAAQFGFAPSVIIVAGTTDGCASFLATGADQPGDGVSALGTTLTVKILSDKPLFAPEFGLYSHRIGDMWLAGGASNTGGVVLAAHFDSARIEELSAEIDPMTDTGLHYYPLARPGERFPINDPELPPVLTPRPPEDSEFLKALFEGIAGIEQLAYQRLAELGAPKLKSVRSVGGGAKNAVWSSIRRRRLKVEFPTVLSEEAAAGAARLALQGARTAGLL
ncbi:FGGY-family carbohydrate kinase [Rhizobium sp. CFBP 8762]|uniref:FGGY-family carbohydrate kinase n=1 Tax=Rhizobium sp. CFBP 8762 TaxID=2775279 RepID=UPI00177E9921|nr:FGGY-family carbohydrate kinase [Rhizobium sp. CFBP 8762]MBD8554864.1 FGGY-family carbohydrate kinase [Rhizobium sp. CFBP 8762]